MATQEAAARSAGRQRFRRNEPDGLTQFDDLCDCFAR
jgi:hypothetical protein